MRHPPPDTDHLLDRAQQGSREVGVHHEQGRDARAHSVSSRTQARAALLRFISSIRWRLSRSAGEYPP